MSISSSDENEGTSGATRMDVQANIYSDSHSPDEISAYLSLQPTRTLNKGPRIHTRTGKVSNIPKNFWQLRSEPNILSFKFTEHLDWMLTKLLPVRDRVFDLRNSGAISQFELTCVVWSSGTRATLRLSARQAETLAHLKLALWFDFADYGKED